MAEALTPTAFEEVVKLPKAVILFHTEQVFPSTLMLTRFNSLEGDNLFSVDLEAFPEIAIKCAINKEAPERFAAPVIVILYNGEVVAFKVGLVTALEAYRWIEEY